MDILDKHLCANCKGHFKHIEKYSDATGKISALLCDECAPEKFSKGFGARHPSTPRSERVYEGERFNTGEW